MLVVLTLALIAPVAWYAHGIMRLAVAYKAKILSSGIFVAGRTAADVLATDLSLDNHTLLRHIPVAIDAEALTVFAGWRRYVSGLAVHRPGLGCTLVEPALPGGERLAYPSGISVEATDAGPSDHWPVACGPLGRRLQPIVERAFFELPGMPAQRTRAIVIVHRGCLVAERYAPGFGPDTPIAGWSLAKCVVNALAGILIREGRLALSDPAPVAAWSRLGDPRRAITVEHLLRMTTGLRFSETYRDPHEDVLQMLLAAPDSAAYAAAKPLDHPPGSHWQYSGGTTNILSSAFRAVVGEDAYPTFPHRELFGPLGMKTAVLEMDAAGNFVGSSFMYASARDWARLGLLYLRDGVWQGQRILPEAWVDFSRRPTPQSPNGEFAAHVWRRISPYYRDPRNPVDLPADAFHAVGYEGQFISIIPSADLVVARLGLTRRPHAWIHDRFLGEVISAVGSAVP